MVPNSAVNGDHCFECRTAFADEVLTYSVIHSGVERMIDSARHIPMAASLTWDAAEAQRAIDEIVEDACCGCEETHFWSAHPQDDGAKDEHRLVVRAELADGELLDPHGYVVDHPLPDGDDG